MGAAYPDLDLSQIVIEDAVPLTHGGDDSVNDEFDDSIHTVDQEVKEDSVVITQPVPKGSVAPAVSSAVDPSAKGGPNIVTLTVSDTPSS